MAEGHTYQKGQFLLRQEETKQTFWWIGALPWQTESGGAPNAEIIFLAESLTGEFRCSSRGWEWRRKDFTASQCQELGFLPSHWGPSSSVVSQSLGPWGNGKYRDYFLHFLKFFKNQTFFKRLLKEIIRAMYLCKSKEYDKNSMKSRRKCKWNDTFGIFHYTQNYTSEFKIDCDKLRMHSVMSSSVAKRLIQGGMVKKQ